MRPSYSELVAQGVVKAERESLAAPLHRKREDLNRSLLKNNLRQKIENRKTPEELVEIYPRLFMRNSTQLDADFVVPPKKGKGKAPPPYNPKNAVFSPTVKTSQSSLRSRFGLAFRVASRLTTTGQITKEERGYLKELILDEDGRVFSAINAYMINQNSAELLNSIYWLAKEEQ